MSPRIIVYAFAAFVTACGRAGGPGSLGAPVAEDADITLHLVRKMTGTEDSRELRATIRNRLGVVRDAEVTIAPGGAATLDEQQYRIDALPDSATYTVQVKSPSLSATAVVQRLADFDVSVEPEMVVAGADLKLHWSPSGEADFVNAQIDPPGDANGLVLASAGDDGVLEVPGSAVATPGDYQLYLTRSRQGPFDCPGQCTLAVSVLRAHPFAAR